VLPTSGPSSKVVLVLKLELVPCGELGAEPGGFIAGIVLSTFSMPGGAEVATLFPRLRVFFDC
jgi:hypothetical protein